MDLKTYLASIEAPDRERIATACGITVGHLHNIAYGVRSCSPGLASALERSTENAITRRDLRPKDWARIWPELAEPKAEQGA